MLETMNGRLTPSSWANLALGIPFPIIQPLHDTALLNPLFFGSSVISGEGRSRQEKGPAIAKVGGHRDRRRARSEWPRNPRNPRTPTQPRKTFCPFTPTPFRGEGGNTTSVAGLRGVRLFRRFRGSSGVGWKGRGSSLSITCPEIPGRTFFPSSPSPKSSDRRPETPNLAMKVHQIGVNSHLAINR